MKTEELTLETLDTMYKVIELMRAGETVGSLDEVIAAAVDSKPTVEDELKQYERIDSLQAEMDTLKAEREQLNTLQEETNQRLREIGQCWSALYSARESLQTL